MLSRVQRLLLQSLLADDPPAELRRLVGETTDLPDDDRRRLERVLVHGADGLRMSGLLVKKLRFERLTRGSRELDELFDRDPAAFMRLFRAYTSDVPPEAYFPDDEARRFREWEGGKG